MPNNNSSGSGDYDLYDPEFWGDMMDSLTSLADVLRDAGLEQAANVFDKIDKSSAAIKTALELGQGDVTGALTEIGGAIGGTVGAAVPGAALEHFLRKEVTIGAARSAFANLFTRQFILSSGARLAPLIIANPILALLVIGVATFLLSDAGKQFGEWLGKTFGNWFSNRDPLILDLDLGGVSLGSLATSDTYFDLDGNGFAERTGWVSSGDGLLALDVNGNGKIDSGSELFGTARENGFTVLERYDENGDRQITSADGIWSSLLIWRDANGDGISTVVELTAIADNDIGAINLNARTGRLGSRAGNPLLAVGSYAGDGGLPSEAIAVAFTSDQSNTRFVRPDGFEYDPDVFLLPNLRGYGALPDLWVAMSLDPVLKAMVQDLVAGNYDAISDLVGDPYSIKHPDYYRYGFLRTGDTTYHYKASAFDDMVARWAGVPINNAPFAGNFDEHQAELVAEQMLGRAILSDRGAGNPNFHNAFYELSNEMATRFVVAMADLAENRVALDLFGNILSLTGDGSQPIDAAALGQLIDQASIDAANQPQLSAFLQRYAALDYDFSTDTVAGDVTAFIDQELQAFDFDPARPWRGYTAWEASRTQTLNIIDPDGTILDERRRAYTGNQMLDIQRPLFNGFTSIVSGSGIVNSDSVVGTISANGRRDLVTGSAGDDMLMGGSGSDAYVFADGGGSDTVVDSAGALDEVAFQGSLTSLIAQASFEGSTGRDLRIRFAGRDETVLIKNYLDASGNATIEKITFPDGPSWTGRFARDLAIASRATSGNDRLRGTVADETILGGDGNDTLGFSVSELRDTRVDNDSYGGDVFVGGAGNDTLRGAWGNDIFRITRGDGHDIVSDIGGLDIVDFDASISPDEIDIRVSTNGDDVILSVRGEDQSVTIRQVLQDSRGDVGFSVFGNQSFRVRFADGTIWTQDDIIRQVSTGTDGDDQLYAFATGSTLAGEAGNDTLTGKNGTDILIGGAGADIMSGGFGRDEYRISRGDGHDRITVSDIGYYGTLSGDLDTIRFDNSITPNDLEFTFGGDDKSLVITVPGEDQSIVVTDFLDAIDRVRVQFTDGTIWSGQQLFAFAAEPTSGDDRFFGSRIADSLAGGDGNDILIGNAGDDSLSGGDGNDRLEGGFGADILTGGTGDDRLLGGDGEDELIGGTGNDMLVGGSGLNIFRIALGDGHDAITLGSSSDQIVIDASQATAGLQISAIDNSDLVLTFAGGEQSITIQDALSNSFYANNILSFSDGSSLTIAQLLNDYRMGTNADDIIFGSHLGGEINGAEGNDRIAGGYSNEIILGGAGDDILSGGGGDNIFRFGRNDGTDRLVFAGGHGNDRVEFGPDILPSDITVIVADDGKSVELSVANSTARLIIERSAPILSNGAFVFENGVTWGPSDVLQQGINATLGDDTLYAAPAGSVLQGWDGNDQLFGDNGSDILDGGAGNDLLEGGFYSSDIYRFGLGGGRDTINDARISGFDYETHIGPATSDTIEFGEGIRPEDVVVFAVNIETFEIRFKGSDDSLIVNVTPFSNSGEIQEPEFGGFLDAQDLLKEIKFFDGTVWTYAQLLERLSDGEIDGDVLVGDQSQNQILDTHGLVSEITGNGADHIFVYERGYGELTINQFHDGYYDPNSPGGPQGARLRFGAGVSPGDFEIRTEDGDILISFTDSDDAIRLVQARSDGPRPLPLDTFDFHGVMFVEFADGTTWRHEDLIAYMFTGRSGQTEISGDEFGGILDPNGFATDVYTTSISDKIIYERGYGAVRLHADVNLNDGFAPLDAGVIFGDGLSVDDAQISIDEQGSLTLDFGNDDKFTIVGGLNSHAEQGHFNYVDSFFYGDQRVSFSGLIDFYNGRLVDSNSNELITLIGDSNQQVFDPSGVGDVIDGGGGHDDVYYHRGYGPLTVLVSPDLGQNAELIENTITMFLGDGIVADDIVFRTGAENEIFVDLGNGDSIRLQFERDPALDLTDRIYFLPAYGDLELYYGGAVTFGFDDGSWLSGPDILQLLDHNDVPTINVGDIEADAQSQALTSLTLAGEFTFDDADTNDTYEISVIAVSVQGTASAAPPEEALISYLFTQIARDPDAGIAGQARWIFAAETGDFDYLAEGETVTLDYIVELTDGRLGTDQRTISIIVNGTNEAPVISGGTSAATLLPATAQSGAIGQLAFIDSDLSQEHIVTVGAVTIAGNVVGLPPVESLRSWLSTTISGGDGDTRLLDWSFAPQGFDFSSLGLTDQLSLTYAIEIRDSSGAVTVRDITIFVRSSDLAAGILSQIDGMSFAEDGDVDLAIPAALFADAIEGNLVLEATLSNGAALPGWLSFDGERLTGTPPINFNGQLGIRITANNGVEAVHDFLGLSIEAVNDAPAVSSALQDYAFEAGNSVNITVPAQAFADADGDVLTYSATLTSGADLPSWLSFEDGVFNGTPPSDYQGMIEIRVVVSDGISAVDQTFNLAIGLANAAPSLALPLYDWQIRSGDAIDIVLREGAFRDADNDALTITARLSDGADLPTWLSFDGVRFIGMPPANFIGALTIAVFASDGLSSATDVFQLSVDPVAGAPLVANPLQPVSVEEDQPIDLTIPTNTFLDPDGDTLSLTASQADGSPLPSWLSFSAGRFTGTPPANFNDAISLVVTASDGIGSASSSFEFIILPVNDNPAGQDDTGFVTDEDTALTIAAISLLANDSDIDGDALTVSAVVNAIGGTVTLVDGQIQFTPDTNFYGDASFSYNVADTSGASDTALASITVLPVNDAPIVMNEIADLVSVEDQSVSFTLASDAFVDVDGDILTYTAMMANGEALPSWLTFDGQQFTGNPPLNFNGVLTIAVLASDGIATAAQQFNLTISAQNDAPAVAQSLSDQNSAEDQSISIILPLGAFADVDGDVLTRSATLADGTPLPAWLTFANGQFAGTPPANFNGTLDITVTASDGALTVSDIFRLTIDSVNDAPFVSLALADVSVSEDSVIDIALPAGTFSDIDGDTLSLSATLAGGGALPSWLAFADGRFTGTPPLNFNGVLDLQITASDGQASVSDIFRLSIDPVNDAPVLLTALGDAPGIEGGAISVTIPQTSFGDVDGDTLILSASLVSGAPLPSWLTFAGGVLTGTSPVGAAANYDIRITASDGSLTASDDFMLTILPSNRAPVAVEDGLFVTTSNNPIAIDKAALLENDSDPDGDILSVTQVSNAIGGTVAIGADGHILFTPDAAFVGNASFSYTVSDGALSTQATARLRIDPSDQFAGWRQGGSGLDILLGGLFSNNRIYGAGGLDIITGGLLADQLAGGDGNDTLIGLSGDDQFWGGNGNDTLLGGGGMDTAYFYGLRASHVLVTQSGILKLRVNDNDPAIDGDDGSDQLSSIERLSFKGGETVNVTSPIILDLDGNGVKTVSAADSGARYDLDGDGLADDTSWIGSTEGLLFLDRDKNGKVTNAGEFSFIDDVAGAKSDLEGLRAFDSNKDGILSSLDARFADFKVWQDRDGDGAAEDGEILTLTAAGVRSINLTGTAVNGTTQFGEVAIINKGSYTRTNGTTMEFLDAALTYFSSATNLPSVSVQAQSLDRKDSKYRISFGDGAMVLAPKGAKGQIDPRAGALGASNLMTFKNKSFGLLSPIILDLDGDGIEMKSINKAKASFDMNGDGVADDTGWTGKGDGFLVIDRNNDGKITHASELSFAAENKDAKSDLEALASLDNNGDRVIDSKDVRFGELKVWVDANGNGVTDAGELKTLAEVGITSINLVGRNLEGTAKVGENVLISTSTFTRSDGSTGTLGNAALAYTPGKGVPNSAGVGAATGGIDVPNELSLNPPSVTNDAAAMVAALRTTQTSLIGGSAGFGLNLPFNVDPFDYFADEFASLTEDDSRTDGALTAQDYQLRDIDGSYEAISMEEAAVLNAQTAASAQASNTSADRLLALITQDMSTFGVKRGENDNAWRKDNPSRSVEFFA